MDFNKELFYKDFVQREDEFLRAPYNPEIEFYSTIKAGDVKKVRELCKVPLMDKPGLGKLSDDPLQNIKFHFVITTALVARYCIEGGMELSEAYSLSDYFIQKADKMKKKDDISRLHPEMCLEYAKRMHDLRKNAICSMQIAECIDYIYDHLHARITVNELAEYVHLNTSYLSRLFKKEVGTSVNEYIRRQKLETAKNMLVYSEYRPAEIASILAFPTQSYFTEIFRKYTGLTPGDYRKQYFQQSVSHDQA
ncbi:MAG: helix-turn-helix domain-containing protein [Eubacterium sp.]|nr:helix-turn-helix domain-containing protein [Eubacterium sp.]